MKWRLKLFENKAKICKILALRMKKCRPLGVHAFVHPPRSAYFQNQELMEYKNPCVTADVIVENEKNEVLLIRRAKEPFRGMYALAGGHMDYGIETVQDATVRELKEETGLVSKIEDLKLFGIYSHPKRDPRGHYVTAVYIVKKYSGILAAADDADDARFFPIDNLPQLAFDHTDIMGDYKKWKLK